MNNIRIKFYLVSYGEVYKADRHKNLQIRDRDPSRKGKHGGSCGQPDPDNIQARCFTIHSKSFTIIMYIKRTS